MSLTDFLLARLAEDEELWTLARDADLAFTTASGAIPAVPPARFADRMLADVEAKRRIVEAFEDERQRRDIYNRDYDKGLLTTSDDLRSRLASNAHCRGLEVALRLLALPYASHPDYREEWRP